MLVHGVSLAMQSGHSRDIERMIETRQNLVAGSQVQQEEQLLPVG